MIDSRLRAPRNRLPSVSLTVPTLGELQCVRMNAPQRAHIEVPRPPDFAEFWDETLRIAEAVDPKPSLTERTEFSSPEVRVFELRYTSFAGVEVAAWCAAPAEPSGPLPVAMHIPGYVSEPAILKHWARRGYFAVDLATRGKRRADAVVNPGFPGLLVDNIVDRYTYSYRGFYMDVVRGIDVLAALPQTDARRFGVFGSSQGGGLGIVAGALRPDIVRCIASGCPYLCGIMTAPELTHSYPYEELNEFLRVHPEAREQLAETVAYYDGLNFAADVRAPVLMHLGLEDDVCPPETGFALYERLECPKRLLRYPDCGHDAGQPEVAGEIEAFMDEWLGVTR